MSHQDWDTITFNTVSNNKKKEESKKVNSNKKSNSESHLEAPKDLGKIILQARTTKLKTQKQLAMELGISAQVLAKWETNREVPTNLQIAKIEKHIGVKLPRCKRIIDE